MLLLFTLYIIVVTLTLSLQMKNFNVNKKSKKGKKSFSEITYYICQEKNIMLRIVFNFQKVRR